MLYKVKILTTGFGYLGVVEGELDRAGVGCGLCLILLPGIILVSVILGLQIGIVVTVNLVVGTGPRTITLTPGR